jgi:alpha-L-fucosidase
MEKFGDWKHADCVTAWTGPESTATWTFRSYGAARFFLELDYACTETADGTEGIVSLGGEEMPFPVLDTGERSQSVGFHGGWPLFRTYRIGIVTLPRAGTHTLTVRPSEAVENGWIKLRSVSLLPVPGAE